MEITIQTLTELPSIATALLEFSRDRKIILFTGEIGAGKTTLIKALGKQLEVQQEITSPTFSIINEYTYLGVDGVKTPLYHMDLYRLKSVDEAIDIGIEDYLYSNHYCFIEWPKVIETLLPFERVQVQIEITADSNRKFIFL